jgi:ABC-type hemin transport system substrate-binding protein
MRQFVLLYPEADAQEVEEHIKALAKAWGVNGAREVVAESLRRCIEAELAKKKSS